ncbi:putative pentatricopeptide repeat-containing protein At1g69350, mitochondrial [Mercurialis annua]|uniref:putative pentatricopeptide repeat-containing protein At1g69350, mitochondrial n=1 Tax=Mercurialis annua TaxID=3986 RepID=UPI00215ECA98|nr:putative pentatricopeptide repeat-containing protein At1g69350, mitochondrial [Mercurialis annua]
MVGESTSGNFLHSQGLEPETLLKRYQAAYHLNQPHWCLRASFSINNRQHFVKFTKQTIAMTLYMPLFRACTSLRPLTQLHSHLLVTGLHHDPQATTKLIESYSQMDCLQSSKLVFETFRTPDSFMWAVLIKCHVWSNFFGEAISLYNKMIHQEIPISDFIFSSIIRACAGFGDLGIGLKVHGRIIKCGFDDDPVVETSLLGMYGDLGCVSYAQKVFVNMSTRDLVSWSSIISCYVDNGEASKGLEMFQLLLANDVELDSVTMLSIAEACGELGFLRLAKSVHGYIVTKKIGTRGPLNDSLVLMYSKCDDIFSAERIFVDVMNKSTASWTAMISCYNRKGWLRRALEVFVEMLESKVEPNVVTILAVLSSCAGFSLLREGKSVHCYSIKHIELYDDSLGPPLIELYAKCSKLSYCDKVIHTIGKGNVVSWNMLISVFVSGGLFKEALEIFVQMQRLGLIPDSYSLSSCVSACANGGLLWFGRELHCYAVKGHILDEFVQNSLIDMYSKCGFVDLAYLVFNRIERKSVVAWNSMISGFCQNGNSLEAISLFDEMYINCLDMNELTLLAALQACSHMGHLGKGKWLHHKIIAYGAKNDLFIDTALIDMYAKCGELPTARKVFDSMSEKSVVSWSAMIAGYGTHGNIDAAISLFTQMIQIGIKPNDITFMNILSACSHSGYVEEGKLYFNSMQDFRVEPNSEHFACMVDLLSRAGDLDEAYRIIKSMPHPAEASIWGALLNGCRIHRRIDMIRRIEKEVSEMKTDDSGYYTLLSNIYAEEGKWDECKKVRSAMKGIGVKKVPGYSTIQIDNKVYRFGAGDISHWHFLEKFPNLALEQLCNGSCWTNNETKVEYTFLSYS